MADEKERERALFEARLEDAIAKCDKGTVSVTRFLTPQERKRAERILQMRGMSGQAWFWGGYPQAERTCLFLLPDYLCALCDLPLMECAPERVAELIGDDLTASVTAVLVRGSRYRTLTHRDYLGSVLGVGLERDAVGDIAVQNEHEAVVFCAQKPAELLLTLLEKVATDTVKCVPYTLSEAFTDGKRYQHISDTVASARLDCVVAALTNLSRDDAQAAVRTGLVEVDFEPTERVNLELQPPLTISVRGYGRFILHSFDGETRKGRLRMRADKLI